MPIARTGVTNRKAGVVSVEFALTAPLLFLFFFGMLEFSRANMVRHALRTACYEGCRVGIVLGATREEVEDATKASLDAVGLTQYEISVTPAVIVPATRDVTVTISASLDENSWVIPKFLGGDGVQNTMTMERELVDQTIF